MNDDLHNRLDGPRVKCGVPGCLVTIADIARPAGIGVNIVIFRLGWSYPAAAREGGLPGVPWSLSSENAKDYVQQYSALRVHGEVRGPNPRWRRDPYTSNGEFSSGGPSYPWAA